MNPRVPRRICPHCLRTRKTTYGVFRYFLPYPPYVFLAVLTYATQDFAEEALKLTDGKGVELILDAVGKPTRAKGFRCLTPFGHLRLYGRAGGRPAPLNLMTLFTEVAQREWGRPLHGFCHVRQTPRGYGEVVSFQLMDEGKLKLIIGTTFPLAEVAEAHRHRESRQSVGKLVLVPEGDRCT